MRAAVALLVGAVWMAVVSLEETTPVVPKQYYCGGGLTNALKLVCNGIYNTVENMVTQATTTQLLAHVKVRSRRRAFMMVPLFRRRRRGVYDECCRKSCTITELSSYCGIP